MKPSVALLPGSTDELVAAVEAGGGQIAPVEEATALVWTNPLDPEGLKQVLNGSPVSWVQLPFAGIESFFAAGVIDADHTWTCTKGVYGPATAEHALALTLAAARRIHEHARARSWRPGGFGSPERRLSGATVVLVGTGGIGKALLSMLEPLGALVVGVNRSGKPVDGAVRTVSFEAIDQVLPEADFVVLAAPLTTETRGLIEERRLSVMKPEAWLVNVARGPLVDTAALVEALRDGRIGGAALDVTDPEPLPDDHPLWLLPNVLITPHIANTWDMAVPELVAMVRRNVEHFARGEPLEGLVDPRLGY